MKSVFGILLMITVALSISVSLAQNPEIDSETIELATSGVESNDDWEPVIQEFDGVEMVLVPAGCFMMGSEDGDDDETPVHEQCFDKPFWIDRYEVTNAQYGSTGCEDWSSDPEQPRNCVSWFDARDYCEARGAHLPTEREWEYAARGPDNLFYPWGNDWNPDLANWADTSPDETFNVGSFPGGISWVGALDMSGNVWEWVNTIYGVYDFDQNEFTSTYDYPYSSEDGREQDSEERTDVRVLRGGSFNFTPYGLRAAYRDWFFPFNVNYFFGFRCASDFED